MQFKIKPILAAAMLTLASSASYALDGVNQPLLKAIDLKLEAIQPEIIALRQDIHQHPELGNREVRTSQLVTDRLRKLGLEVKSGVGVTGVVAVLKGGKPGPVVALRSELDALPVVEKTGLPYASSAKAEYNGENVGVMHACGHDGHIAILLGVAEALAANREKLAGTVKFIFQPAEEGPPNGEAGGASLMIKEGALENPRPGAIFMLHVGPGETGSLSVTKGPTAASSDHFTAKITGVQTHGASPWRGIDPVPIAAEVILALQQIPSRQTDLIANKPPVISIGRVDGGIRHNIIPESISLDGTLRAKSNSQREDVLNRIQRITEHVAAAHGAKGEFILDHHHWPAGFNDPALVDKVLPSLQSAAKASGKSVKVDSNSGYYGEDFWEFAKVIPGLAFGLGVTPAQVPLEKAAGNHSPYFLLDDSALIVGQKAFVRIVLDYLAQGGYKLPPVQQP
ncbi:amidohydrolase [Methylobacillus gramineus]|uniref:amidohydrolase n=1 Tax=Methylobacillus gramineus TaxID=755169 RepID=UPI001CFF61CB|nr:amidohydrolase [Methylobacillus gramineus]MCB5185194.1 amidohydrolase [Methylobacillus gramineus]